MSRGVGPNLPGEIIEGLTGVSESRDQPTVLVTVDANGFPRVALLSRSEIEVVHAGRMLVALWRGSRTTANIHRSRKATLFRVDRGVPHSIRVEGYSGAHLSKLNGTELVVFDAAVVDVQADSVDYASLIETLVFQVTDPERVRARWLEVNSRLVELARRIR